MAGQNLRETEAKSHSWKSVKAADISFINDTLPTVWVTLRRMANNRITVNEKLRKILHKMAVAYPKIQSGEAAGIAQGYTAGLRAGW